MQNIPLDSGNAFHAAIAWISGGFGHHIASYVGVIC